MARIYLDQPQSQQVPKKRIYLDQPATPKKRVYLDEKPKNQPQSGGFWRTAINQLVKPLASATNAVEDVGKTVAAAGVSTFRPDVTNFQDAKKKLGVDFLGHQKDVWTGENQRTPSVVMNEIAAKEQNPVLRGMQKVTGYGGDFLLDPLNKVKVAALTAKGNKALKTGEVALSAADQAKKGQRALLQFGNMNILPSVGNRVLAASTKANDALRATKYGAKAADMLSGVSTSIRPSGVSRGDFKVLREATTAGKNVQNYTKDKAVQFAVGLEKSLRDKGATPDVRSAILHAIEKGDKSLAPQGLDDVFEAGVKFKGENEAAWKALGGSTLDNYGLAHVATDEVAEAASSKALRGFKLFSSDTPQDIHREWVKVDGKVTNLKNAGIKYSDEAAKTAESPLLKEVGKYKSAEEFVKAHGEPLLHGTTQKFDKFDISKAGSRNANDQGFAGKGIYLTNSREVADTFASGKDIYGGKPGVGNIVEAYLKPNAKVLDVNDFGELADKLGLPRATSRPSGMGLNEFIRTQSPIISEKAQKMGFDAIKVDGGGTDKFGTKAFEVAVLNPDSVKTKSQLTDLYNKAQGGVGGYVDKAGNPVNVTQATAKEINESLVGAGKSPLFKEDLPTVVARMGISTGRKQAGVEFLEATKGLEGKAKELANETYEKMTNVESVAKAIKAFDKVQNLWKAQVLVAPSYHIRNEVGNLWNNFLANVGPDAYVKSTALQKRMASGTLSKADEALVETMKKEGVIGTGQYGGDITQSIADEIGGASWAPWKQNFGLYKGNRAIGSAIEDNAKIAHYLQKIGDGFNPKEAAESVKKYLFDYGDLTWGEQNILKRVMPFYTWTRKNLPLQIEQFFNQPGKFSNVGTAQRNIESGVETPDERYLNDYIKGNTPMRWSTNEDGSTSYLLLGQWLPAASAVQMLSQDPRKLLDMISPVYKVPKDFLNNQSFFKDTLGENQPIEKYPGEMKSFLGMDMGAKTANVLRNIRVLSELDKLNPGLIFGGKDTPSMIPGGSQNRGARQTPDAPELTRWRDFLVGKTQTYDPANSKTFYDRDTENRMGEYTQALDQALRYKNEDQAKQIIRDMEQFQAERQGGANKVLDQFNLMGDQYLEDRFKNKQAEYSRKDARDQMKELIKEGVRTQNPELLKQAAQLDPTYLKDAIKAVTQELATEKLPDEVKRKLYQVEQKKTEQRMLPFYTK